MKPQAFLPKILWIVTLAGLLAMPASAVTVEKEFPFELDEWIDIEFTDGPITIHRIRIETKKGNWKSKISRPTNAEFMTTVQVQIDCTNESAKDVDADLEIVWIDGQGEEIDGYRGKEEMDEEERDTMTAMFSTLNYGLDKAKKLKVKIQF